MLIFPQSTKTLLTALKCKFEQLFNQNMTFIYHLYNLLHVIFNHVYPVFDSQGIHELLKCISWRHFV